MIDQQTPIEPPPSIDDILTHPERIGRVDFTHRLAPAPVPEPEPVAEVEETPVAEVEPAPSVVDLIDDDRLGLDPPLPPLDDILVAPHPAMVGMPDVVAPVERQPEPQPEPETAPEPEPIAVYPVEEPAPPISHLPLRQASPQVSSLLSLVPAEDAATVSEDIDDVVDGVIARIREAQHATLVHLEAIEAEAALRCEMLTAQAELDAELIRLHARREAHAIIAAARQRSGVATPAHAEDQRRRLDQLGEAAMRLAEELEALGVDPGSPDHPFGR